jgi:hypothetical protein
MSVTISHADLIGKDKKQLKEIAAQVGVQTIDGRSNEDTIIKEILRAVQPAPQPDIELRHSSQKPVEKPKVHTPDEVRAKIQNFLDKEGFEAKFDDETWHFRYNGREDSGHLSTDMRVIVMKAESVARGRLSLKGFKDGKDFVLWA